MARKPRHLRIQGAVLVDDFVIGVLSQDLKALGFIEVLVAIDHPVVREEVYEELVASSLDDVLTDCVEIA